MPAGKVEPLGNPAVCTIVTPGQLSLGDTANVTLLREHWPGSVATTRSAGHAIAGSSVSTTATVKDALSPSAFVQVTVVMPTGKNEPLGGVQITGAQSPVVAGGGKFTTAPHWPG